jgi:hypothetical protein
MQEAFEAGFTLLSLLIPRLFCTATSNWAAVLQLGLVLHQPECFVAHSLLCWLRWHML